MRASTLQKNLMRELVVNVKSLSPEYKTVLCVHQKKFSTWKLFSLVPKN